MDSRTIPMYGDGVDWIICALKSSALSVGNGDEVRRLMAPLVGKNTQILVIMNGLDCEEKFVEWFGAAKVSVGMAFTCVNRNDSAIISDGNDFILVNHIAFGSLQVGHCQKNANEMGTVYDLFRGSSLESKVSIVQSVKYAQWAKLCWNLPFTGLCVALGGVSVDVISRNKNLRSVADRILSDTLSLANAYCYENRIVDSSGKSMQFDTIETKKYCWFLTDTMGAYQPSTVLDLKRGQPIETDYLFERPLSWVQKLRHRGSWDSLETLLEIVLGMKKDE
jgi:2-dehydropantoate 2-reductase